MFNARRHEGSNIEHVGQYCNWIEWYLRIWTMSWKTDFGEFISPAIVVFFSLLFHLKCQYAYICILHVCKHTVLLFCYIYFILKICWTSIPTTGKIRNTYFSSFFLLLFKGLFIHIHTYESVCVCVWNELFYAWEPQHSLCFLMHAFYLFFCCICIIICC